MSPYARLGVLLLKWEDLRSRGQNVSVEELCQDCPELVEELRRLVSVLEAKSSAVAAAPPSPAQTADPLPSKFEPEPGPAQTPAPSVSESVRLRLSDPGKLFVNSNGMQLTLIAAGEFTMGSPASDQQARTDEKPQHRARITKPFYLGVCEVTVRQFRAFVEEDNYETDAETDGEGGYGFNPQTRLSEGRKPQYTWRNVGREQSDDAPVVNVSYNDARNFCKWLSRREHRTYRLPTEAEWEYACRAGTMTRFYARDDDEVLQLMANYTEPIHKRPQGGPTPAPRFPGWEPGCPFTAPVGRFKANAFGLFDMHGNVWEWCSDWYGADYYAVSPKDDPQGPDLGSHRVIRGGSWREEPVDCRAARRARLLPRSRDHTVGFRVVCVKT